MDLGEQTTDHDAESKERDILRKLPPKELGQPLKIG